MAISSELNERLEEVFQHVAGRLRGVSIQFGVTDFPEDNGVAFRNDFLEFSLGFISELRHPDDSDAWFNKNLPLFENLSTEQLVKVIAILHFYAVVFDVWRGMPDALLRISLDWIDNTYRCSEDEAPEEWYRIAQVVVSNGEIALAQVKMYEAIASVSGADPTDEQNLRCWGGMSFIVRHGRVRRKSYAAWCKEVFGD